MLFTRKKTYTAKEAAILASAAKIERQQWRDAVNREFATRWEAGAADRIQKMISFCTDARATPEVLQDLHYRLERVQATGRDPGGVKITDDDRAAAHWFGLSPLAVAVASRGTV